MSLFREPTSAFEDALNTVIAVGASVYDQPHEHMLNARGVRALVHHQSAFCTVCGAEIRRTAATDRLPEDG